ncbi:MAG: hypothetical protein LBM77_13625 [Spirochaetaceae bacterium]|jgi:hypothetical protein|nr:hypothetical protein [Spirochaetaceae bacterium]
MEKTKHFVEKEASALTVFFEYFSRLLPDVGKLIFGSLVLGTFIKGDIESSKLMILGSSATIICFITGYICTVCVRKEKKNE